MDTKLLSTNIEDLNIAAEILLKGGNVIFPTETVYGCVVHASISVDPINFNRGFYQISMRIYVKLRFEACVCKGNSQEFEGIAVVEKKVILYGSEGNVSIYKSGVEDNFCHVPDLSGAECSSNMPIAVLEVADPIVLGVKIRSEEHTF